MSENAFEVLGLSEPILKALKDMGFEQPTTVQAEAVPAVLEGKDLLVMSKTGSGKTGAFGLPIIEKISLEATGPKALILTPTRELAVQVDHDLKLMAKHKRLPMTAVYGQHNINTEITALEKGAAIITGTPGRVFDHISQGTLKTDAIEYLVLDEADRMLDMGFIDQVVRIIKKLPKNRQTMLFSATMPPEIKSICAAYMKEPHQVSIASETKTVDTIHQTYVRVKPDEKRTQLERMLTVADPDSCMVFCNTRIAVDKVKAHLLNRGFTVKALHGANSQSSRLKAINSFKKNEYQVLVATDVAARGIHIEDLALVINYDVPTEKDSYVHRIGRTGRAGNGGRAITMVTADDLFTLYDIEEHIGVMIEEEELPSLEAVKEAMVTNAAKPQRFKPMSPADDNDGQPRAERGRSPRGDHKPRGQNSGHQDRKPHDRKPHEKKAHEPRVHDGKPVEKKPYEKKPYEKKPYEKKPYEKKPYEKRPYERKTDHQPSGTAPATASHAAPITKVPEAITKPAVAITKPAEPVTAPPKGLFAKIKALFGGKK